MHRFASDGNNDHLDDVVQVPAKHAQGGAGTSPSRIDNLTDNHHQMDPIFTQCGPYHTELSAAIVLLRQGKLIGLPTETVYGLAADAENELAVRSIFAAK